MNVQYYKPMTLDDIIKYLTRGQNKPAYPVTTVGVPTITFMIRGLKQVQGELEKLKTIAQKVKQQNDPINFYNRALEAMDNHKSLQMKESQYLNLKNLMAFYKKCSTIVTKYHSNYVQDVKKASFNKSNFWHLLQDCLKHAERMQQKYEMANQISQSSEHSQHQMRKQDGHQKNRQVSLLLEKIKIGEMENAQKLINEFDVSKRQILSEVLKPIIAEFEKFANVEEQIRELCGQIYTYKAKHSENISDKCISSLQYLKKNENRNSNNNKLPFAEESNIECTFKTLIQIYCQTKEDQNRLQQHKSKSAKCKWLSQQIQNQIYNKAKDFQNYDNPISKNVSLKDLFDLMQNGENNKVKGKIKKGMDVKTQKYKQKYPQKQPQPESQKVKFTTQDYYNQFQAILVEQIKQLQWMKLQQFKQKYQKLINNQNSQKKTYLQISPIENIMTNVLESLGKLYQLPKYKNIISYIEELTTFKSNEETNKFGKQQQRNENNRVNLQNQSQIQRLKNLCDNSEANYEKEKKENERLQQTINKLSLEINKSKEASNNIQKSYDSKSEMLQSQIQSLKVNLQQLNSELKKEKQKSEKLESALKLKSNQIASLKLECKENEQKLQRFEHKCAQLEGKAQNLQKEIKQHENKVQNLFKDSQTRPNFDGQIELSNIPQLIEQLWKLIHSGKIFVAKVNLQIYNSKCIARKTLKKQNQNIEQASFERQKQQIYNAICFPQQYSHLNVSHIQSISIQSDLFENQQKQTSILGRIAHYFEKSDIDRVSLVYKSSQKSEPNLDKMANTLLILQTQNGENLAAYSSLSYCQTVNMEQSDAFLISTLSQNVFPIKKDAKSAQSDNDYLIFGNGCIKIRKMFSKQNRQQMSTNFATKECGIDSLKEESSFVITGSKTDKTDEIEIVGFEIYQIVFKYEKLIKTNKRSETQRKEKFEENKEKEKMDKLEKDCRLYKEQLQKYKKTIKTLKSKIGADGSEMEGSNIRDEKGTVQIQIEDDPKIESSKQIAELSNKVIELQTNLEKSNNQIKSKQNEIDEKNKVIAEMKKQHSETLSRATLSEQNLRQENQKLKQNLEDESQNSKIKTFNSVQVKCQQNNCDLAINKGQAQQNKLQSLDGQSNKILEKQSTVQIEIEQVKVNLEHKKEVQEIEKLEQPSTDDINVLQSQLKSQLKAEQQKNAKLVTENEKIEQKLLALAEQLKTQKQKEKQTNQILSQQANQIKDLQAQVSHHSQSKVLESQMALMSEQKKKLEQSTKQASARLAEIESSLKKLNRQVDSEKVTLKGMNNEIKKNREQIAKLGQNKVKIVTEIKKKQQIIKKQDEKIQQLEAKAKQQQETLDVAKKANQKRQQQIEKKVKEKEEQVNRKDGEVREHEQKTKQLQEQMKLIMGQIDEAEVKLNGKNRQLGVVNSQLIALNTEMQKKKKDALVKEPKIVEKQKQVDPIKKKQQQQKLIQKVVKQSQEKLKSLKEEYEKKLFEQECRIKQQQKSLSFCADIKQNEKNRLEKGISKNNFFIGDIIESSRDRDYLVKQLEIQNNKYVVATKLLFSFPLMKGLDLHNNVNDKAHYIVLVKMQNRNQENNNFIIALYSQKPLAKQQGPNKGLGFISSVTNQKAFYLSKSQTNHPRVTQYHDFYVVFGNSEIKFKLNQTDIQFNIGHNFKSFETAPNKTAKVFTGLDDQKSVMESYEIYQIFFDHRK